jgi:hypothetical protein
VVFARGQSASRGERRAPIIGPRLRAGGKRDESSRIGRVFFLRCFFFRHQRGDGGRVCKLGFLPGELFEKGLNARIMRERRVCYGAAIAVVPDGGEDIGNGGLCGGAARSAAEISPIASIGT